MVRSDAVIGMGSGGDRAWCRTKPAISVGRAAGGEGAEQTRASSRWLPLEDGLEELLAASVRERSSGLRDSLEIVLEGHCP